MASQFWPAPMAPGPLDATVRMPGSKSATNRALILAALAPPGEVSHLLMPLRARDTQLMVDALRALGIEIDDTDDTQWSVTSWPLRGSARIDVGLAGTVMRFIPAIAGLADGDVAFDGDAHARKRPIAPLLEGLRTIGAGVEGETLPFVVRAKGDVPGGEVTIDASTSSQFISALLLAGARYTNGVTVHHDGGALPSTPHIDMTLDMVHRAGATVVAGPMRWQVLHGPLRPVEWQIEPDLSNAAPFLAAALATRGVVRIPDWPGATTQAGGQLPRLLRAMGAEVTLRPEGLVAYGSEQLRGIDVDLGDVGELTPVIAALCTLAQGSSHISGVAHLRGHETDRLAGLARELTGLGATVEETPDGLTIDPRPLHGGVFRTYDDHRMAQAGALVGLVTPGIQVENIATVAKTMPDFVERWESMLNLPR